MPPTTAAFTTFERNNFFYGLLMDAQRFQKDHRFFNEKRAMINRLGLGAGVLCGLDVRAAAGPGALAIIDPGVAIDGAGHELVISESRTIDPHQLTDDGGRPSGAPLTTGVVEIRLAYLEIETDPVPVLVPDCDHPGNCALSTIRESVTVIVRSSAGAPAPPIGCGLGTFPLPPEPGLHDLVAARVRKACPVPLADASIPIARVDLTTNAIDTVHGRPLAYSNRLLYELLVCLADRLGGAATRILRYVSGDGQQGAAGEVLDPFVVELVDSLGNPIAGELVQFTVSSGGGSVAAASATTAADGRASTSYTLGATPGVQQVTAKAVGTPFTVTFRATRV
jgi:Bacterial Ig-like domain (group 1)